MAYWKHLSFWAMLFIGWFVTVSFIGLCLRVSGGAEFLTDTQQIIFFISANGLALIAGFAFARAHASKNVTQGFDVIMNGSEHEEPPAASNATTPSPLQAKGDRGSDEAEVE